MELPTMAGNSILLTIAERIEEARKLGFWKTRRAFVNYLKTIHASYKDDGDVRNIAFTDNSSLDVNKKTAQIIQVWDI